MKKDQLVMVYEDPITRSRPEGDARLIKPIIQPRTDIQDMGDLEYWEVEFLNARGNFYPRWVSE